MPSRAAELLGDLGFEVSYRVSLMRLSYDCSNVILLSGRIPYRGNVGSYDVVNSCSKVSGTGDAAFLYKGNGIGIFLMVPRIVISLC